MAKKSKNTEEKSIDDNLIPEPKNVSDGTEPKPEVVETIQDANPEVAKNVDPLRPFMQWFKPCGVDEGTAVGASVKNGIKADKPVTEKEFRDAVEMYLNARTY